MKKTFLICVNLLLLFNLYADTYNSNAIGQKLGKFDNSSEYYLIEKVDNNILSEKLYKDNILIQTKAISQNGDIKTVTIDDKDSKTILTYNNDQLINEKYEDIEINYNYSNNLLESKTILKNNKINSLYYYFYSLEDKLQGILKVDNNGDSYYSSFKITSDYQSLSISNSNTFKQSKIHNGVINSVEYENDDIINNIEVETLDNNQIILIDKQNNQTNKDYFTKGILNKTETFDKNDILIKTQEFFYDENYLKVKEIITEKLYNNLSEEYDIIKNIEIEYKDNKIVNVTTKENNNIISSYYFDQYSRKIENLYENNKVYCTITYDDDKIIDIQYREGSDDL